jgi:hypothetical protein
MPDGPEGTDSPNNNPNNIQSPLDRDMVKWTRAVAIFTGLLVAANVVSNLFIYGQYRALNDTQKDNREQLRAAVTVEKSILVLPGIDQNKKLTGYAFVVSFHNFGGTRTATFYGWDSVKYFDGSVPNNLDLTKPFNPLDQSTINAVIGPQTSFPLPPVGVSADDVDKVVNKKGVVLLWGMTGYSDLFEPNHLHREQFCLLIEPVLGADNKPVPGPTGGIALQSVSLRPDCNKAE